MRQGAQSKTEPPAPSRSPPRPEKEPPAALASEPRPWVVAQYDLITLLTLLRSVIDEALKVEDCSISLGSMRLGRFVRLSLAFAAQALDRFPGFAALGLELRP